MMPACTELHILMEAVCMDGCKIECLSRLRNKSPAVIYILLRNGAKPLGI